VIRLAVRCAAEQAEAVLAELLQVAPNGVEERSGHGWVEYAIYGGEGELPDLGAVEAGFGDALVEVRAEPVPDDWADRWREFHRPTLIAGRVVVRPSWRDDAPPAELEVVLDPGQAFGTGAHPTTRLCIELLLELADQGRARGPLADLGTGSGVLAIVAAKLGWRPVLGVDHAEPAITAARENAAANGADIELRLLDLRSDPPPAAPVVVANLTAPLLRELAPRLAAATEVVVCSGLLARERADVERAFADAGFALRDARTEGDWAALLLARP
jgi:ribosomal protein L11 methyltransferase